ncbi:hypothetical protein PI125_g18403 [Phytophthora idaei]|nr:hypothetical protein PI125_g18403 [Phytophthora idaei]
MGIRNSVRRNEESGEVEYLEHVIKCIQPFDYETTYTSVWKVAGHPHRQLDREVFAGAAGQENTIAVKFRLERTLTTGTKVSIKQWLVVRRFIEEDRVFHGWKIYSEDEGILRGIYSDETGWIRHNREVYEHVDDPENTRATKFRLKKPVSGGSTVSILKRVVARRFFDE